MSARWAARRAAAGDINSSGQVAVGGLDRPGAAVDLQPGLRVLQPADGGRRADRSPVAPFLWDHGKKIDLGTLGGFNSSAENKGINEHGQVVGVAETTTVDPDVPYGAPTFHAFLWRRGRMIDLGTQGEHPTASPTR